MKKLLGLLLASVACAILQSCDPIAGADFVMVNHSGHGVKVVCYHTVEPAEWNQLSEPELKTATVRLKDGDSLEVYGDSWSGTAHYEATVGMVRRFWQDSVRFEFDDGTMKVFHPDSDTVWGPYAFETDNYTYYGEPNKNRTFRGLILAARLTYTLRPADYEACITNTTKK